MRRRFGVGAVRRGELWWGSPRVPGVASKRRPFLIVSDDVFNTNPAYRKILVVHLTTARRAGGPYRWEVVLPRDVGGLPLGSVIKCNEVYTLFKEQLVEQIGRIPAKHVSDVDHALRVALGMT